MNPALESWQKNEVAREAWRNFLATPEGQAGLRALESQAVPVIVMGEPQEQTAKRQSFQAGYHMCLFLLGKLPTMHFKKVQQELPAWDYIQPNAHIENDDE